MLPSSEANPSQEEKENRQHHTLHHANLQVDQRPYQYRETIPVQRDRTSTEIPYQCRETSTISFFIMKLEDKIQLFQFLGVIQEIIPEVFQEIPANQRGGGRRVYSGYLTPVVLLLTHQSTITNHHSLLQPGISYLPAPVRRYVYPVSIRPTSNPEHLFRSLSPW
ncbi:unnamed protein product [Boreogadus saida]